MKHFSLWFGLLLGAAALGCDDDEGSNTQSTAASTPEPETPVPGAEPEGNDNNDECPANRPSDGNSCDVSFMTNCEYDNVVCNCLSFGDSAWRCQTVSNPPNPQPGFDPNDGAGGANEPGQGPLPDPDGVSENSMDCPGETPSDGTECSISFLTDCNYDGSNCNCVGGTWSCAEGDDMPEPSMEPEFEPFPEPSFEPEPEAPSDAGPPPDFSPDDAGTTTDPDNPESCPRREPPDDVCDIDNVGFGTECRYGYQLCTCGGFPGEGVWSCEYEFPPNPESCPDEAPPDLVCDIDSVGFGTECRFGGDLCVCGGFPGAGEWQCREALTPPEPEPSASDADAGVLPEPDASDAG